MTRGQGIGRGEIAAAAALIACWLAFTAWVRPLALPDEGRYVSVVWEMVRSGNWMVPTLDGLPFFHKPPLFYWITAAAQTAFGVNQWSGRAASLFAATIATVALYLFARRWSDVRVARWSVVVLVTMPFFFGGAQYANLDMLVAACISVTILLCAHAALCLREGRAYRAPLAAAYATAALGMLAKGLIGFVLPAVVIVLWLLATRQLRLIAKLLWLPGLVLFAAICVPWFVAMQREFSSFFQHFFIYHHLQRFEERGFNNEQPIWFYGPVIVVLTLPWIVALYAGMRGARNADAPRADLRKLMWIWTLTILVFFSIPASKLVGYIMPAVPPLAFLIAEGLWATSTNAPRTQRVLRWLALFAAVLCVGTVTALALMDKKSAKPLAQALTQQRAAGEPVVFVDGYYHDLVVYARLTDPVVVIEDWNNPEITKRDNWRKELVDGVQFDAAAARKTLVPRERLAETLCAHPVTWVLAPLDAPTRYAQLQATKPVAANSRAGLWKVTHDDRCTQKR